MSLVTGSRASGRIVRFAALAAGVALAAALVGVAQARMTKEEWAEVAKAEGWPTDPAQFDSLKKEQPQPIYRLDCTYVHNVGRIWVLMNNLGQIGEEYGDFYTNCLSAEWPAGSGNEYLFVAGPWVGALLPEVTNTGTTIYSPHVSTTAYQHEFRPDRFKTTAEIYSTYEGSPYGTRIGGTTSLAAANDDKDKNLDGTQRVDEEFLNGEDDDADGAIDEDFAAISQQMFTTETRDDTPEARARWQEHVPLGIRMRQTSYAWSTAGTNDFIGIDYSFTNVGADPLSEVYLGFFVDGDIGPYANPNNFEDDLFDKLDTLVTLEDPTAATSVCQIREFHLQMAYMFDVKDDPTRGTTFGGDVSGYAGTVLLGHTVDPLNQPEFKDDLKTGEVTGYHPRAPGKVGWLNVQFFSGTGGIPYSQGGDPSIDEERYDLLCNHCPQTWQGGNPPPDKYASLRRAYQRPSAPKDYRYIVTVGPFPLLEPDSTVTMSLAYVVGDGRQGLIENAINLLGIVWEGDWKDVDNNFATGVDGRETCVLPPAGSGGVTADVGCMARDSVAISVKIKNLDNVCRPENYVNLDCNKDNMEPSSCTPNPKFPGAEYWRHWVSTTPPPPPNSNLHIDMSSGAFVYRAPLGAPPQGGGLGTGTYCPTVNFDVDSRGDTLWEFRSCVVIPGKDRKVILQWDNASELIGNPVDHTDDFRGYRVWRASNWKRPVGTIAPDRSQWELLADYAMPIIQDTCLAVALALKDTEGFISRDDSTCRRLAATDPTVQAYLATYFGCGEDRYMPRYPEVNKGWLPCITDPTVNYPVVDQNGVPESSLVQVADPARGLPEVLRYHYPVGLYEYVDNTVLNGMAYFYAVTAYRYSQTALGRQELHSLAVATEPDLVVPQSTARNDLKGIRVIPNPYVEKADWDLTPAPQGYLQPTGTKVEFQGLPRGQYNIRIFTLAGDLVKEIRDTDQNARRTVGGTTNPETGQVEGGMSDPDDGTAEWNLVTRNGQDVTSGVYLYTVDAPGRGTQSGKFILVRGAGVQTTLPANGAP